MKFCRYTILSLILLTHAACVTAQPEVPQTAPKLPGEYKLKYIARIDGKPVQMAYALILPKGYDTEPARKFPMIVFTHGAGECGTDGEATFANGPGMELRRNNPFKETFPFIVLQPQCPPRGERWDQPVMYKAVSQIVDAAIGSVRVDPDRVYLTGLSMGGKGCWMAAMEGADRFAAIAPICAGTTHPDAAGKLRYVAVWMISGTNDPDAMNHNNEMMGLLKNNLAEVRNTIVPGADHVVWPQFYASAQFYEWLLSHKRPNPAERRAMDAAGPYAAHRQVPPRAPGHYRLMMPVQINGQPVPLVCSVYLPKAYSPTGAPSPLLVYLHEYNTIGTPFKDLVLHGPDAELEKKGNELWKANFPFVVISPQIPAGLGDWGQKPMIDAVKSAVEELVKSMSIDKSRVYATGTNEGGIAAWQMAIDTPGLFAAAAPILTIGGLNPPGNAEAGKDLPTWATATDLNPLKNLFEGKDRWKLSSDNPATAYRGPGLYEWLLKQKK